MDKILGHNFWGFSLASLLGPSSMRLAALARVFRGPFCLQEVRRSLLAKRSWLLVTTGEEETTLAVRAEDGICLPWPKTLQINMALCLPKLGILVAVDCGRQGSMVWAWDTADGTELWRVQTGTNLLRPLWFIASACAVCAAAFEGVFMWCAKTGRKVWQALAKPDMPVDRVWFSPAQDRVFARTSEMLGLASELLVWSTEGLSTPQEFLVDASASTVWTKTSMQMIMALVCHGDAVYARFGQTIFAWEAATGVETWQRKEASLPRLPTLPTHLLYWRAKDVLFVGVGTRVLAWSAKTSEELFRVETPGSLIRHFFLEDGEQLVGLVRSWASSLVSWSASTGRQVCQKQITGHAAQVNCVICRGRFVYVGIAQGDVDCQEGIVEAWNASTGQTLWHVACDTPVVSLLRSESVVFVGTVGAVSALVANTGALLWRSEISGTAKSLTYVARSSSEAH